MNKTAEKGRLFFPYAKNACGIFLGGVIMKCKITSLFVSLLLVFSAMLFVSCGKDKDVDPVVIDLGGVEVSGGETLLDIMEALEEEGELSFKCTDGMITSINGTANAVTYNPCWMLYTSDEENANTAWGTFEHNGETLGSAVVGAESLVVKTGEIYVWVYQSF